MVTEDIDNYLIMNKKPFIVLRKYNALIGYSITLPTEIKSKSRMCYIKLLFAFLYRKLHHSFRGWQPTN